ncbi:hypothetical protein NSMM_370112 [Nitrosomonas mobilis]|uniref:Uncharacterized protein n=1 Tax=Nitrosomonas mobilis TaxID=51642 RepID=A0A1G5SDR5_9PROT|nr:hypothetical protein NSMM_370112 [Nitrosomonas mobilis]
MAAVNFGNPWIYFDCYFLIERIPSEDPDNTALPDLLCKRFVKLLRDTWIDSIIP